MALPTNWTNNIGMQVDSAFLNQLGEEVNANTDARSSSLAAGSYVATLESTTSTSYADLTTITDAVTLTPGQSGVVLVAISAGFYGSAAGVQPYMSFALSGGNTKSASDSRSIMVQSYTGLASARSGAIFLLAGLSAASTVFKAKYKTSSGTATFVDRSIAVIPL